MFVQSSHFIEHEGGDTAKKAVFYGQEKNRETIRIAKMNLAVHGLEGKIAEKPARLSAGENLCKSAQRSYKFASNETARLGHNGDMAM